MLLGGIAQADVTVENAYVRAMPPGQKVTGAFMLLTNTDNEERLLLNAESDVAKTVELHTHINENGLMKMRPVEHIAISAGNSTELKPGSYHVMLIGLNRILKPGDEVELLLTFDDKSSQTIMAPVKKIEMTMGNMKHGEHKKDHKKMSNNAN